VLSKSSLNIVWFTEENQASVVYVMKSRPDITVDELKQEGRNIIQEPLPVTGGFRHVVAVDKLEPE
jgi:hypothetical protein